MIVSDVHSRMEGKQKGNSKWDRSNFFRVMFGVDYSMKSLSLFAI